VYAASLLNLDAIVTAAREAGEDVAIFCAGVEGELALDDAYTAGRLVETLGAGGTDAATAAVRIARSFESAYEGLAASRSAQNLFDAGLDDDVAWCARESVLDVVPRLVAMRDGAAELVA
jgi:2-phosphosulfolactate phosphatase